MKPVQLLLLVGLLATLPACGQKGPLVLPDPQHPHKKAKFPVAPKPPAAGKAAEPTESAQPAEATDSTASPAPAPEPTTGTTPPPNHD